MSWSNTILLPNNQNYSMLKYDMFQFQYYGSRNAYSKLRGDVKIPSWITLISSQAENVHLVLDRNIILDLLPNHSITISQVGIIEPIVFYHIGKGFNISSSVNLQRGTMLLCWNTHTHKMNRKMKKVCYKRNLSKWRKKNSLVV